MSTDFDQGKELARELKKAMDLAKSSYEAFLKKACAKLAVSDRTLRNWAKDGKVPADSRSALRDFLSIMRREADPHWKLAISISDLMGTQREDFSNINRYISSGGEASYTTYRLARDDGALAEGTSVFKRDDGKPRMMCYSYSESPGVKKSFSGPVFERQGVIYAVFVGGAEKGEDIHLRTVLLKAVGKPQEFETYGVALSETVSGPAPIPLAAPIVLFPEQLHAELSKKQSFRNQVKERLRSMVSDGIIAGAPNRVGRWSA